MPHLTTFCFQIITSFSKFGGLYIIKEMSFHLHKVLYKVPNTFTYVLIFILFLLFHFQLLKFTSYFKVDTPIT